LAQVAKPSQFIDEICKQLNIPSDFVQKIIIEADATQSVIWIYITQVGAKASFDMELPKVTGGAVVMRQDAV
jgi:galactitol-specific phosphotransferase system IIB component